MPRGFGVLPAPLASRLPHRLALVARIGSSVHLLDPRTGQTAEVTADAYWRCAFRAVASRARRGPRLRRPRLRGRRRARRGRGGERRRRRDRRARERPRHQRPRERRAHPPRRTARGGRRRLRLRPRGDARDGRRARGPRRPAGRRASSEQAAAVEQRRRGRPSCAQRRRRRRPPPWRPQQLRGDRSDAGSAAASTSSYQTELDDFDDEAVDEEMREEVDALAAEFAAMHPVMDEGPRRPGGGAASTRVGFAARARCYVRARDPRATSPSRRRCATGRLALAAPPRRCRAGARTRHEVAVGAPC